MFIKMDSSTPCILVMFVSFCNILCWISPTAANGSSPALFVFGASLLDFGNNIYTNSTCKCNAAPYGIDYPGLFNRKAVARCSNGRNIIDFLVEILGVPSPKAYLSISKTRQPEDFLKGVNFASCGAGILSSTNKGSCISMDSQIDYYSSVFGTLMEKKGIVQTQRFISNSIFFIEIGNNDIQFYDGTGMSKYVSLLISALEEQLKRMYKFGARKFAFMGTEPVGCWPALRAMNKSTGDCNIEVNQLSVLFNEQAALLLQKMQSEYADMNYSFFDAYKEFNKYINHPETYGFEEVKAACCGKGFLRVESFCYPWAPYCSDRTKYLFWDGFHQTEGAAKLLARAAIDGLPPIVFPINMRQLIGLHSQIKNARVIQFAYQ